MQQDDTAFGRLSWKRAVARTVLLLEALAPRLLWPLGIALLFVSAAWFGLFRALPFALHIALVVGFLVALIVSLLPLRHLRWPDAHAADRLLESRNGLKHQALQVQADRPAVSDAFGLALWKEHRARMAAKIGRLETGLPQPDIARHDRYALRSVPVLLVFIAFAFSGSNRAGTLADVVTFNGQARNLAGMRLDAWITPPAYTGRPPVFLTSQKPGNQSITVPESSILSVRFSGDGAKSAVTFRGSDGTDTDVIATEAVKDAHQFTLTDNGTLTLNGQQWPISITKDAAPVIAFEGEPKPTVNGALEIGFTAKDDYALASAMADIVPLDTLPNDARPLYPLPQYKLDLPRSNGREVKGLSSRNLSDHPLSGKRVAITLVAKDSAGQEGRSETREMIMPARIFTEPLAASVAEQRQVFSLNANDLPHAIDLADAVMLRPEETIPNTTHYLLLQSAKSRMQLTRNDDMLREASAYLWEIAMGIENGDLSDAEKRLRDAQQALSDALEKGASEQEVAKLTADLKAAMDAFMQAMAEQAAKNPQANQGQPSGKMLRQQDLDAMMKRIEELSKAGAHDEARKLLSEMNRMMNNLQMARPQQNQQNSPARQQLDKLGNLLQQQQKLLDETFKLNQQLNDRMMTGDPQMGDPLTGEDSELFGQENQPSPTDQMTAEQLKDAIKKLQGQQQALKQQLDEAGKAMEGMGMKPGQSLSDAGREMGSAADSLGEGDGEQAQGQQGRALDALRKGAQDMMKQMQAQGQGQGGGQGQAQQTPGQGQGQGVGRGQSQGQNGRDPLGRDRNGNGEAFADSNDIPDDIDIQRARQILEDIRRKLGGAVPEVERQYLERLLDIR